MKMNDGNLPNPCKLPFYRSRRAEHFLQLLLCRFLRSKTTIRTLTEEGAPPRGKSKRYQASLVPAMCMKMKDGNLPNTGKLPSYIEQNAERRVRRTTRIKNGWATPAGVPALRAVWEWLCYDGGRV